MTQEQAKSVVEGQHLWYDTFDNDDNPVAIEVVVAIVWPPSKPEMFQAYPAKKLELDLESVFSPICCFRLMD